MEFDLEQTNEILDGIKQRTAEKKSKLAQQKLIRSLSQRELQALANKGDPTATLAVQRRKAQVERDKAQQKKLAALQALMDMQAKMRPPAPVAQPFGVSHQGAEALSAAWMRHLGALDAQETRVSSDGGIDVVSANYIAQVKNYAGSVGAPEVQQLAGIAYVDRRTSIFFTSGSYTFEAIVFANKAGIPLLVYSAEKGTLSSVNRLGDEVLRDGLQG